MLLYLWIILIYFNYFYSGNPDEELNIGSDVLDALVPFEASVNLNNISDNNRTLASGNGLYNSVRVDLEEGVGTMYIVNFIWDLVDVSWSII